MKRKCKVKHKHHKIVQKYVSVFGSKHKLTLALEPKRTLLKMDRYYNTPMCHYWDMSVK